MDNVTIELRETALPYVIAATEVEPGERTDGKVVTVPAATWARWDRVREEWEAVQAELEALYDRTPD